MTDPRVHSRRGKESGRKRLPVPLVVLLLFTAAAAVTWYLAHRQSYPDFSYSSAPAAPAALTPSGTPEAQDFPFGPASPKRAQNRLVYPYSVIPGGVKNLADLKLAIADDPVVARQFQGFNFHNARLVQVAQPESMFVSYRIGQKVYWTRKKIPLHKGETLVTDGHITARTRCGNRVAAVPLDTGSPLEPPQEAFNQPYAALIAAPVPDPAQAGPGPLSPVSVAQKSKRWWTLPLFAAPLAAWPHSDHSSSDSPLAVTPEPGMSLLLISGLAGVYWRVRKHRRKE